MHRLLLAALAVVILAGCGVVAIEGRTPPISTAAAKQLAERYYDHCNESTDIGQCDSFLSPVIASGPGALAVAPPFTGWMRIVEVRSNENVGSLAQPGHEQAVLTSNGARFCGGSYQHKADDSISGCSWLVAPASVTVEKLMQSGDKATLIGRIAFSPVNPTIVAYMRSRYDTQPLDALAKAQGREITLHFTHANNAWRVGNPEMESLTFAFMIIAGFFALLIVGALMRVTGGKSNESIPAGPAPSIGFSSGDFKD